LPGLSQLYEYRYIQNVEKAKCPGHREPSPRKNIEMEDYLLNDRGVLLVWDATEYFIAPPNASANSLSSKLVGQINFPLLVPNQLRHGR